MIHFCYIASAITFCRRAERSGAKMALETVAAAGEKQARVGDNMGGGPGTAADQQTRVVGMNMQQRALLRRSLHCLNNVLSLG